MNSIDFHGYTIDEVSGRLTNFLVSFKHGRDDEATIVVGKGEVVRPYVIDEVERSNIKWRYDGSNTGAIIIYK